MTLDDLPLSRLRRFLRDAITVAGPDSSSARVLRRAIDRRQGHQKLTPAEEAAYRELARAARKLRAAQQKAGRQRPKAVARG